MTRNITLGVSSYSFQQRMATREMDIFDVIDWVAASDAEHLELAVLSDDPESPIPNVAWDPAGVDRVRDAAKASGVALSNLAMHAEFWAPEPVEVTRAVEHVERYVELATRLGITRLRHDVVAHPGLEGDDTPLFEQALPGIVEGSKRVARFAAERSVTTSLENHGYFVQSSDRIRRILHAVDEPNFMTTLDVGNFVCVDEDSAVAAHHNLPYAMIVHFKDFYIRDDAQGDGWFRSRGGKYLRGAIVGNGDLPLRSIAKSIVASDYEGFASIEFEGEEDCLLGIERGLANARRLLAEA